MPIFSTLTLRCSLVICALGILSACQSDPTPIVEETETLGLAPGGARGANGISAVTADYRLGPNDRTRITVFGEPNLTGEFTLDGSGRIAYPLIGNVDANGLTPRELQSAIATRLNKDYLVNPSVTVEVLTRRPFYVLGEVQKPGNYPYVTDITALNAVAMAGGYTYRANTTEYYIKRLDKDGRMVRVVAKPETKVRPGDTLEVRERYF
ncbi:MAG: polysaccharide biosynthesis/export family protein [Pseudomonadota bacterium]